MTVDTIIFDLDGTLIDSLRDIGESMNRALEEVGLPTHEMSAYRGFVGEGAIVCAQRAIAPEHRDRIDQVVAAFKRIYADHLTDHTGPYPEIPELLDTLRSRDIQLACLSNKPHEATCQAIQSLFAPGTFSAVYGHRTGVPLKPDPTSALEIASLLHTAPMQCAFLGDTAIDMQTAGAAGMLPVGVLWGFRGQEELAAAGAQAILARPLGLLRVLDT